MATSKKTLRDNLRTTFLEKVVKALKTAGEDVLVTGSLFRRSTPKATTSMSW